MSHLCVAPGHTCSRRYCGQQLALSTTGQFEGEETIIFATKSNEYGPVETNLGNLHTIIPAKVARYVRYSSAGSDHNAYVHILELDVLGERDPVPHLMYKKLDQLGGVSYALGPGLSEKKQGSYIDLQHGNQASGGYSPHGTAKSCAEPLYITVDLGKFYQLGAVRIWNYYGDLRKFCGQKLSLSLSGKFAGEEIVVWQPKEKWGPAEVQAGNLHKFKPAAARYVRYYSAGSSANNGVHMVEIDIMGLPEPLPDPRWINLDQLRGVKVVPGPGLKMKLPRSYIDMNHSPSSYRNSPTGLAKSCREPRYLTVDLGKHYSIGAVTLWNYYADGRKYCGQKLAISRTGQFAGEESVVWATNERYGPKEIQAGNKHMFKEQVGRFVRYWSAGNDRNNGVHMVEIDIWGKREPVSVDKKVCSAKHLEGSCGSRAKGCPRSDGTCGFNVYGHLKSHKGRTCDKACAGLGLHCHSGIEGSNNCRCEYMDKVAQTFSCDQDLHELKHKLSSAHYYCKCTGPKLRKKGSGTTG